MELVDYTAWGLQDKHQMLKINCNDLGAIRVNLAEATPAESMNAESASPGSPEELDGDRNQLPE